MALNRSDKSRILRRYFPGMTRNSEMSTEPRASSVIPYYSHRRISRSILPLEHTVTPLSIRVEAGCRLSLVGSH